MKNNALLGVLVLVLAISACSTNLPNPTPTLAPIAAATVTPLPGGDIIATLVSNGFRQIAQDICSSHNPCTAWWSDSAEMGVTVEADHRVIYVFPVGGSFLNTARMVDKLLTQNYGVEVDAWVANHIEASVKGVQTADINGFSINMKFYEPNAGTAAVIYLVITSP